MTKTPLCSCRLHSCSTAISLPYTYSDCRFSCGRSRARHPQVAVVHLAAGPFTFSMTRLRSPLRSAERAGHPPPAAAAAAAAEDKWSLRMPVLTFPLGHKVIFHQGLQNLRAYWSCVERSKWIRACSLARSLAPSPAPSLPSCAPAPTPPLRSFSFAPQLINYSVSVSHPHMNQAMSRG